MKSVIEPVITTGFFIVNYFNKKGLLLVNVCYNELNKTQKPLKKGNEKMKTTINKADKITIEKINNNWAVVVENEHERGIHFQGYGLAAAKHIAAVLRRDIKRHSETVVSFDALV